MLMLGQKDYSNAGKTAEYIRQRGIDSIRFPEMILELAKRQGGAVTKKDVMELLHVSKPQAYKTLQQMREDKLLKLEGKGRFAFYRITGKTA
ncbi:hypothetical protein MAF45_04735 [Mesosutterella sp. OilRF-GAM-744-9]|uniref:Uncharacterized protein n=1 Tax=Mesosutterella porci TaxID=2915351 RepID=A0ABS9MQ65_9BURK|nr:hypothetical protein [Mesosutterella sp. oilRF-744-WT-GAM-9]MCG5030751.1 hypothetical protein [Mesosutterella sp. oilRF-744-WT-GAM-9]